MIQLVLGILLFIIIANYVLERWLTHLNIKHTLPSLPEELEGIFDEEKYKKSQLYKQENARFSFYSSTFSMLIMVAALLFGLFGVLDSFLAAHTNSYYVFVFLFFGIIALLSDILGIPFEWYDTFRIEEKYGFNKTSPALFVSDKLKSWLLMAIFGGGILILITWIYTKTGSYFWLLAWGVLIVFTLFMNIFYSNLIVPLFNKQTPLEEGELRNSIDELASRVGYDLKDIYVIDGSKRSSKANAYFTGFGPKKRIVLFDTLIKDLETEEIVAVLAHEIGHYKLKHSIKGLILAIFQAGIMLYLFSLFVGIDIFSQALGGEEASFHMGLIAFSIIYSPLSMFVGILTNLLSRKNEFEADAYASEHSSEEKLISALKKLTRNNLSNLTPHPLYVFFHYSHPTLYQRIKAMRKNNAPTAD